MSAWTEAVWIVQQMEKQFQASGMIDQYENLINDLRVNLNDLNDQLQEAQIQLQRYKTISVPFVGEDRPLGTEGMIWFQTEETEEEEEENSTQPGALVID